VLVSNNKDRVKYNTRIRNFRFKAEASNCIISGEKLISVANTRYANGELFDVFHPIVVDTYNETVNIGSTKKPVYKTYRMYLIDYWIDSEALQRQRTLLIPELDIPSVHGVQLMTSNAIRYNRKLTEVNKYTKNRQWLSQISISTYGYATSVHKSQGNEWNNVYIDCGWLSNNWNKSRWLYTAITRAKKKIEIIKSSQFKIINYGKLV
jgi:exodeoxyribonuclease-5